VSVATRADTLRRADGAVGVGAVAAAGCGLVLALAGAGASSPALAAVGGVLGGTALVVLVAAGWVDGIALVLLSLPLPALYGTATLRIAAAAPVTAAVVFAWMLGQARPAGAFQALASPRRATVALVAALAVTMVFAQHPVASLRELLNFGVLLGFFVLATDTLARDRARVARLAPLIAAVAAVCGALAVLETVGILPGEFPRHGTPFNRAALGFGQPNGLGLFLAVALPFAVHTWTTARGGAGRVLGALALAAVGIGLFGTFSRGSWLSLVAGGAALALAGEWRFLGRFGIAIVLAAIVLDLGSGGMIRDTAQRTLGDWVLEQRAALMLAGILMFLQHPWVGVGPGGYAESLDHVGAQVFWLWDYLPTPHNAYVQMAAEGGVIGLAAFCAFLLAILRVLVRGAQRARADAGATREEASLRRALLWSFATACAAGFVIWPLAHGTGQLVLLVAAMGLALEGDANELRGGGLSVPVRTEATPTAAFSAPRGPAARG